jgi:hypothetical protein
LKRTRAIAVLAVFPAVVLAAHPEPAPGQQLPPATFAPRDSSVDVSVVPRPALPSAALPPRAPHWWAPLASAALPGAGQLALDQDRFVAYLALEAFAWLQYTVDLREGNRQRRSYRDLARRVARAPFGADRPDGDFDYYERMEHYVESGVYDAAPGGPLEPEANEVTYNGSIWLLARQTYWDDPASPPPPESEAYRSAVDFYEDRAVRPEFQWSWRDAQLEQDLFRRTISRSNEAFRRSVTDLGVVIANHVLSTVDAYISLRLSAGPRGRVRVSADVPFPGRRASAKGDAHPPR